MERNCGSEMPWREIDGTTNSEEHSVENKLRERNLGDKITKVTRKEIWVTSGNGIQKRKVGEDWN